MTNNFVSKYFENPPFQWGLRGDPYLWEEMKLKFNQENIPTTANDLDKLLRKKFKELTGELPEKGKTIYVDRYNVGSGMSSGTISSDFWLDTGFPLIFQRYIDQEMR